LVSLGKSLFLYIASTPDSTGDKERDRKRRLPAHDTLFDKNTCKKPLDGSRGDKVDRAKRPIIRWKDSVPSGSRTPKDLFETISMGIPIQPIFPAADLVRDSNKKKMCFPFCLKGSSGGCKRKPNKTCPYAHNDGDSDSIASAF
jgi:hypothetical protein